MKGTFYGAPTIRYQTFKSLTGIRIDISSARRNMETITPALEFEDKDAEEYWLMMIAHLNNIYSNLTKFQQANTQSTLDSIAEAHGEEPWK